MSFEIGSETGSGPDGGLAAILCRLSERPVWAVRQAEEEEGRSATVVKTETATTVNAYVTNRIKKRIFNPTIRFPVPFSTWRGR